MKIYFICTILVGILIVCFALAWIVVIKKKARDYRLEIDERSYELQKIIQDADQLLIELNNYSSYIVNRMEEKQQAIEDIINKVDEKISLLEQTKEINHSTESSEEIIVENSETTEQDHFENILPVKNCKLISLNEVKREVVKLYKKGISSTEIAKMLNVGKGEIELISRMCK